MHLIDFVSSAMIVSIYVKKGAEEEVETKLSSILFSISLYTEVEHPLWNGSTVDKHGKNEEAKSQIIKKSKQ